MNFLPVKEFLESGDLLYVFGSCIVAVALVLAEIALLYLRERSIRGYLGCAKRGRTAARRESRTSHAVPPQEARR